MCHRNNRRSSKQLQIIGGARFNAEKDSEERKHEMEVDMWKVVKAQKDAQSAAEIVDRRFFDDILALMDKNFIPSARRTAGTEGHQQRTLKRSSSLSKSNLNRSQRSDRQHRKPRTTRILRRRVVYPRTHSTT